MDIGRKLKEARTKAGLTQEEVTEKINVSRQTISNWENNKSYPDIVSVINLSDLYSISLDKLLKEDNDMIQYLEASTNKVKSIQKFSKLIQISIYLLIWAVAVLSFWFSNNEDAMGYALMVFYMVLPVTTFIISIFIGKDTGWSHYKWFMLLFFGVMYMLAGYSTFSLANAIEFHKVNLPQIGTMIPGIICSGLGMIIGSVIKFFCGKNRKE